MSRYAIVVYNLASGSAVDPDLWLGTLIHRLCNDGGYISLLRGQDTTPRPVRHDVAVMIDGDECGKTPVHIEVIPNAVNVLVPKQLVG